MNWFAIAVCILFLGAAIAGAINRSGYDVAYSLTAFAINAVVYFYPR